jgi:hypothetical protein
MDGQPALRGDNLMADLGAELKEKVGPLPLYAWLLIMTAAGAAAYFLLKKKSAASPGTGTPGTACTMSDGSAGTWDSTGTVCQASTVSTVNSMAGTGGGRGWRGQSSTATATTTPAGTAASSDPGSVAGTVPPVTAPITTTTGTGNPNSGNWSFPAPSVTVTGASKTSTQIVVHWTPVKGPGGQTPASYTVRIFRGGTQIRENAGVGGTSFTENGLAKGTTGLTINVWANGGPLAPPHGTATT